MHFGTPFRAGFPNPRPGVPGPSFYTFIGSCQDKAVNARKYNGTLIHRSRDENLVFEIVEDERERSLHFGTPSRQSSMYLQAPDSLVLSYTRAMMSFLLFCPRPRRILLIGLGGGSMAKFLLHHYQDCRIDAVESNGRVIELAQTYFQLPHTPRLCIFQGDGAQLNRALPPGSGPYDAILVDAFTEKGVPEAFLTEGFFGICRTRLNPGGILAANLWAGPRTGLKKALASLTHGFGDRITQLPVEGRGNIIVLASTEAFGRRRLKGMGPRADALYRDLGVEFPDFLRRMRRVRPRWWRLLG